MWSDYLVSCDCGFHSVCPLMEKDKRLWKLPDGRDWLRGKLGLVLMGRAMLSKSSIQFSVDGWSCALSLLFTWGQTMIEVMKIMVTSFKRMEQWPHKRLTQTCLWVSGILQQRHGSVVVCCRLGDTECSSTCMGCFEGGKSLEVDFISNSKAFCAESGLLC